MRKPKTYPGGSVSPGAAQAALDGAAQTGDSAKALAHSRDGCHVPHQAQALLILA